MNHRQVAVMLAGTLRPSPLREALDVPVLCLPIDAGRTLLDAWLQRLRALPTLHEVIIVVNAEQDVEAHEAAAHYGQTPEGGHAVRSIVEPTAWRGPGGVLHDVSRGFDDDTVVIAIEASTFPATSIVPLVEPFVSGRTEPTDGVVGTCGTNEPAGIYAFTARALHEVPEIGFHDVKEQFLPNLHKIGMHVCTASIGQRALRLRDREGYLEAVQADFGTTYGQGDACSVSRHASVSGSAVLDGRCVIDAGAVVEDGAIVHDSVVMHGATIGGGAVVSQCVVGPLAAVEARRRAVRQVISPVASERGLEQDRSRKEQRQPL